MITEEKLEKLKKLADAMYYAAQQLTTDASRLHKAMDEYHKFIIYEYKEEPVFKVGDKICFKHCETNTLKITKVSDNGYYCEDGTFLHFDNQYLWELAKQPASDNLEKAAVEAFKQIVDSDKNSFLEIFKAGANWQKEQIIKRLKRLCNHANIDQMVEKFEDKYKTRKGA